MYDKSLSTFVAVASCGSFAKAAEQLYISPTAIMKQMDKLEAYTGTPLLIRSSQGTRLTPAGESFYKDALKLIEFSDKIRIRALKAAELQQYTIRVGTSFLNPCKVIMDLWSRISDTCHKFKLHIVPFDDNHNNIISVIDSLGDKFDIIAGICSSRQWLSRCNFLKLRDYPMCFALPRSHPLASKKIICLEDLHGEELLLVKRGDSTTIDSVRNMLEKNHPEIILEDTPYFYDTEVFNRCESEQKVLLTLPHWKDIHPGLVTVPADWNRTNSYGIIYGKNPSPGVEAFLEMIKKLSRADD